VCRFSFQRVPSFADTFREWHLLRRPWSAMTRHGPYDDLHLTTARSAPRTGMAWLSPYITRHAPRLLRSPAGTAPLPPCLPPAPTSIIAHTCCARTGRTFTAPRSDAEHKTRRARRHLRARDVPRVRRRLHSPLPRTTGVVSAYLLTTMAFI